MLVQAGSEANSAQGIEGNVQAKHCSVEGTRIYMKHWSLMEIVVTSQRFINKMQINNFDKRLNAK
jgi:hypothetical protein